MPTISIPRTLLIAFVIWQVPANLVLAETPIVRHTETTEVRLTFVDSVPEERAHAARYWGAGNRRRLSYPALSEIQYILGTRRYRVPKKLVEGIGSINVEAMATAESRLLVIRDDDRWTVITLRGADGSNAFIAEWRIERATGCVIRYVRDLEAPGRVGTPYGPEILIGQVIEANGS